MLQPSFHDHPHVILLTWSLVNIGIKLQGCMSMADRACYCSSPLVNKAQASSVQVASGLSVQQGRHRHMHRL